MKSEIKKCFNEEIALFYAIFLLSLLFSMFFISCIGFFLGFTISPIYLLLSILISISLFYYLSKSLLPLNFIIYHLIIIILLLSVVFLICINIFDTSYDGLWYHQTATIRLASGWNPFYHPYYDITRYDNTSFVWIQHYPKASWIMAACIYKLTGFIEAGKMINFIVIATVFFYAWSALSNYFRQRLILIIICLILSFSPIASSQIFSYYLDGILSGMVSLILLSLIKMQMVPKRYLNLHWFVFLTSLIIATNLKFTGLYISGIIIFLFSIYWWWKKEAPQLIFKKYFLIGTTAVMALCFFGFNPYITNTIYKGNIFYPLNKKENYKTIADNEPLFLRNKNNIEKLFISVASLSENDIQAREIKWKNPVKVSKDEIRAFAGTDVRVGGFGPLFFLAILISLISYLFVYKQLRKDQKFLLGLSVSAIFISAVLVPMSGWARYVPQFYIIPVILIIFSIYASNKQNNLFKKYIPIASLAIYLLNLVFIIGPNLMANAIKTRLINQEMTALKHRSNSLEINFSKTDFQAVRTRLKEAGVNFKDNDNLKTKVVELRTIYNLYGYGPFYNK